MYKPIVKFNGGYGALLCNECRVIIKGGLTKDEFEGKTDLIFCDKCWLKLYNEWIALRTKTADKEPNSNGRKEKLCYCGHTTKCECLDPSFEMFKEHVLHGNIILGDPRNGWRKLKEF